MDLKSRTELEIYFADHFDTILFPILAEMYFKNNELSRSRKVCEIGLKHHPKDSSGLFILSLIEKKEGNLKKAEKVLGDVLLYSPNHLVAAIELCEIQTVLGRAKSRLLKSWKRVLNLDSSNKTAKEFVEKNDVTDNRLKSPEKKTIPRHKKIKLQPNVKKKSIPKKAVPTPVSIEEYADPLKVSPRLATFTLVSVLKNQGLFSQALDVLDALEKKGESPESIALERETIEELVRKLNKE